MKNSEKNTHLSRNILVFLISKSKTLIYSISLIKENFPKIAVFKTIILKYNIFMKKSEKILNYPQIFLLFEFLNNKPKSTIFLKKMKTFEK